MPRVAKRCQLCWSRRRMVWGRRRSQQPIQAVKIQLARRTLDVRGALCWRAARRKQVGVKGKKRLLLFEGGERFATQPDGVVIFACGRFRREREHLCPGPGGEGITQAAVTLAPRSDSLAGEAGASLCG